MYLGKLPRSKRGFGVVCPLAPPVMLQTVKKALSLLPPRRRLFWLALIPLALIAAGLEALVAGVTYALLKILADGGSGTLPGPHAVYELLPGYSENAGLRFFVLLVAVCFVFKNVFVMAKEVAQNWVVVQSIAELSKRMLRGYLAAPYTLHLQRNSAELIRNVTSSVDAAFSPVLGATVVFITEALVVLSLIGVLVVTSPLMTLLSVLVLGTALLPLLLFSRKAVARWGKVDHEVRATMLKALQQSLGGIKEVKVLGRERFFYQRFARDVRRAASTRHRFATLNSAPRLLVETTVIGGMLLVMAIVIDTGTDSKELLSLAGLFGYTAFRLIPSANRILIQMNTIRHGERAVSQLHDDHRALRAPAAFEEASAERLRFDERIVLSDVSFSYPGTARKALADVEMHIARGECVGIVGATGAGKSSLVDLLLGVLPPTTGSIEVDGKDVASDVRAWQSNLGYVPQHIYLTDDTLLANVAFGVSETRIDRARAERCLEQARLLDLLTRLPQGVETVIGERGTRLSGGERQRVGIARALYTDPDVIVFDEATSALDNSTERQIMAAIEAMRANKTLILVAHRLTTIERCDRLFFLEEGRLTATGTYRELLDTVPAFRAMATSAEGTSETSMPLDSVG